MDFVTAEEKKLLEEKLDKLVKNRSIISERIAQARELGDLKENAEYHAARDEQGMQEAEIRRLEEKLANAQTTDDIEIPKDMVFLGSVVKLLDLDTQQTDIYKIVGQATGNFDSDEIEITSSSPMGEELMKARINDTISVDLPRGRKKFKILEIM